MRARKKPKLKQKPNPWEAKKKVANPMEVITNPWEAKKKVTNPMENIKNPWEAKMKVANPTDNIKNPWEAKMKVTNPPENLLEVLYLPEVQNCPQTPMGEREEEMVLPET